MVDPFNFVTIEIKGDKNISQGFQSWGGMSLHVLVQSYPKVPWDPPLHYMLEVPYVIISFHHKAKVGNRWRKQKERYYF